MKTLDYNITELAEPLFVKTETLKRFSDEDTRNVLINGIATHIIGSPMVTRYDEERLKDILYEIIDDLDKDDEMPHRVSVNGQMIIIEEKSGDGFVFRAEEVRPEYIGGEGEEETW